MCRCRCRGEFGWTGMPEAVCTGRSARRSRRVSTQETPSGHSAHSTRSSSLFSMSGSQFGTHGWVSSCILIAMVTPRSPMFFECLNAGGRGRRGPAGSLSCSVQCWLLVRASVGLFNILAISFVVRNAFQVSVRASFHPSVVFLHLSVKTYSACRPVGLC